MPILSLTCEFQRVHFITAAIAFIADFILTLLLLHPFYWYKRIGVFVPLTVADAGAVADDSDGNDDDFHVSADVRYGDDDVHDGDGDSHHYLPACRVEKNCCCSQLCHGSRCSGLRAESSGGEALLKWRQNAFDLPMVAYYQRLLHLREPVAAVLAV